MTLGERKELAKGAKYVGSEHHTDVPKYGMVKANPRDGAGTWEEAEASGLKNPACLVCPRKWVRRQEDASKLVQKAIEDGNFISDGEGNKPSRLWGRDPDEPSLVYEAKLCSSPNGYKAYPLTSWQVEHNLPFELP